MQDETNQPCLCRTKVILKEILHDPVMAQKYIEAINAQIELEIELVRRENEKVTTKSTS